ncbi:MAG: hypothetical protein KJ676_00810 [Alphaproteobacteria bacterium]|nr:hypothetical protein [Alphaproteobacteria bacterium]MBU1527330.1 hypothetical protein [Alphaproteobacteria bacterium]MBU2118185.1 hypothetical protein [Alphaproteobacteria bacterium]MBU2352330.1 hypothetical protein [Alphaproteobacteria bacterium]MBU2382935.1 hypothetical protein [Alphaproteobacteria bacterium]
MVDEAQQKSRRAEARKPRPKARISGRPWWLPFAGSALTLAIGSAVAFALALTGYLALGVLRPELAARVPTFGFDPSDNLTTSVVFFWLDVFAIAAFLKSYEWAAEGLAIRRRFYALYETVAATVEAVWDARYGFAVALDVAKSRSGAYDVDMFDLNQRLGKVRTEFVHNVLCDVKINDHGRLVVDRVLRALDAMITETYDLGKQANGILLRDLESRPVVAKAEPPSADEAGDAAAPAVDPAPGGASELEEVLERMFEMSDPRLRNLEQLKASLEAAGTVLGFKDLRKLDPSPSVA